jgi:hypothetical protein
VLCFYTLFVQKAGNEYRMGKSYQFIYLFSETNEQISIKISIIEHILEVVKQILFCYIHMQCHLYFRCRSVQILNQFPKNNTIHHRQNWLCMSSVLTVVFIADYSKQYWNDGEIILYWNQFSIFGMYENTWRRVLLFPNMTFHCVDSGGLFPAKSSTFMYTPLVACYR